MELKMTNEVLEEEKVESSLSELTTQFLVLKGRYRLFFIPKNYNDGDFFYLRPIRSTVLSATDTIAAQLSFVRYVLDTLNEYFGIFIAPQKYDPTGVNRVFVQNEAFNDIQSQLVNLDYAHYLSNIRTLLDVVRLNTYSVQGNVIIDQYTASVLVGGPHHLLLAASQDVNAYVAFFAQLSKPGVRMFAPSAIYDTSHRVISGMTNVAFDTYTIIMQTIPGYTKFMYDTFYSTIRSLYLPTMESESSLTGWLMDFSVSSTRFSRQTSYANEAYDVSKTYDSTIHGILSCIKCSELMEISVADSVRDFENPVDSIGCITFMLFAPVFLRSDAFCLIFRRYLDYAMQPKLGNASIHVANIRAALIASSQNSAIWIAYLTVGNYRLLRLYLADMVIMNGFRPDADYFCYTRTGLDAPPSPAYYSAAAGIPLLFSRRAYENVTALINLSKIRAYNLTTYSYSLSNAMVNNFVFDYYNELINYFFWMPINCQDPLRFRNTLDPSYFITLATVAPDLINYNYMLKLSVNDFLAYGNWLGYMSREITHLLQSIGTIRLIANTTLFNATKLFLAQEGERILKPFKPTTASFPRQFMTVVTASQTFEYSAGNSIAHVLMTSDFARYVYHTGNVADQFVYNGYNTHRDLAVVFTNRSQILSMIRDSIQLADLSALPTVNTNWSTVTDFNHTDEPIKISNSEVVFADASVRIHDPVTSRSTITLPFNNYSVNTLGTIQFTNDAYIAQNFRVTFADGLTLQLDMISY